MTTAETPDYRQVLTDWRRRLRVNTDSHNNAERRFVWLDNTLGAIALMSIVGLGSVAAGIDIRSGWKSIVVVLVTGIGALASAFQTQLRLGATALAHQTAARQYSALRRNVEEALHLPDDQLPTRVREIRQQWDLLAGAAPNVPRRIRRDARSRHPEALTPVTAPEEA